MRIFVAYRYSEREAWVKKHVYRLVNAFGSEVVDGEDIFDALNITQGVLQRIKSCQGFIGVISKEVAVRPWVQQELGNARGLMEERILALYERDSLDNLGMFSDKQNIMYDTADLVESLVQLAVALGKWHAPRDVLIYFLPDSFVTAIRPYIDLPGLISTYEVLDDDHLVIESGGAKFVELDGGPAVKLRGIPRLGRYVQFKVVFGADIWISGLETVASRRMTMKKL